MEEAMRLGILVPTRGVVMQSARRPPVDECWTMARLADNAGYDAVWVGDSIVAKPRLEPMTTLAYLAGITTRVRLGTAVLPDRKSTRLNSSHGYISYAVFCLKKK